jgi:hypothetical protein
MSVALKLQKIDFRKLNARQKESHNFQKISGLLADYGFTAIRLSDDWNGADFLAQHVDGKTLLRVQLKSRLGIYRKYQGKNLWVCFPDRGDWYLYPHDVVLPPFAEDNQYQEKRLVAQRARLELEEASAAHYEVPQAIPAEISADQRPYPKRKRAAE